MSVNNCRASEYENKTKTSERRRKTCHRLPEEPRSSFLQFGCEQSPRGLDLAGLPATAGILVMLSGWSVTLDYPASAQYCRRLLSLSFAAFRSFRPLSAAQGACP